MSLFGLFHVVVGLGILAKDAISDECDDNARRPNAIASGQDTYLVNGYRLRSTKTGEDAYISKGIGFHDHELLLDKRTHRVIEDLTQKKNDKKQIESIEEAKAKGSVFYRTTQFDVGRKIAPVYVSDSIPGYFRYVGQRTNNGKRYDVFEKGELEKLSCGRQTYRVNSPLNWQKDKMIRYYQDGSIYDRYIPDQKNKGEYKWTTYYPGEVFE